MESAIPQHLVSRRTQLARMKPDWQPPYPSFVARFAPSVARVAMDYFGVQYPFRQQSARDRPRGAGRPRSSLFGPGRAGTG